MPSRKTRNKVINTSGQSEVSTNTPIGQPNAKQEEVNFVYGELELMIEERNRTWRQFNDRTLVGFLDDSEKRTQGYVPDRDSQGKTEDQANVFRQDTRNKLKAIVAAISSQNPEGEYKAVSKNDGGLDTMRAGVMKDLVSHSRLNTNPVIENFWDAWTNGVAGTVVKYDGYMKAVAKRKIIKSFNKVTGAIEFDEKKVVVQDEAVELNVPLPEIYIKNFYIHDIQKQPALAWVRYLSKEDVEFELGHYKDWSRVKTKAQLEIFRESQQTFMNRNWMSRVEDDQYEVVRYYNKNRDTYDIIVNGILLLEAPLLWGSRDKQYPFAKTIFEPFSGREFFYGNSLPNANMDIQDVINALWNMMLDKTGRSMNPPMVAGIDNKDLLEEEYDRLGMESTIYVEDVNQIKYAEIPSVNQAEFGLLKMAAAQFDLSTVDTTSQGFAGKGTTAREIVVANENAKKLLGIFFNFMEDLWIQKTKLRILNVLMNYTIPKTEEIVGEEGALAYQKAFRTITVEGADFPNNQKGTLQIQIVGSKKELPSVDELDIEEEKMRRQGVNFQKIAFTSTYLDQYDFDFQVVAGSVAKGDTAEKQAVVQEKMQGLAMFFPDLFMANRQLLFEEWALAYEDNPDRYKTLPPEQLQQLQGGAGEEGGTPATAGAAPGRPSAGAG